MSEPSVTLCSVNEVGGSSRIGTVYASLADMRKAFGPAPISGPAAGDKVTAIWPFCTASGGVLWVRDYRGSGRGKGASLSLAGTPSGRSHAHHLIAHLAAHGIRAELNY